MDPAERQRLEPVFETILDAADAGGIGIAVSVDEGEGARIVYANQRAAEINGRPLAEFVGQFARAVVAPEDLPAVDKVQAERRAGNLAARRLEVTLIRPDGTRLPVELGIGYAEYQGHVAAVSFVQDISERRRMLSALQASEARFRRLIEQAPEAIGVERDGAVLYANPALTSLLGLVSADEIVGRPIADVVHPDDRARFLDAQQGRISGPPRQTSEYRIVRPEGGVRALEVVAIGIDFEGAPAVLGFARDVTERNRVRSELVVADRLLTMGTLAAGVGHEINNPLAYALLNLQALEYELPHLAPTDRLAESMVLVRNALTGIERVRTIARDLRAFSRADPDTRGPVNVQRVLESTINMASHEIRLRARLVTRFERVPRVLANEARLGQVFLNLLLNAAQALPEKGGESNEICASVFTAEGGRVVVEVADTGPGIPAALLERIFEPYFTTKPIGSGTGLGLFIGRGIVTSLGGTLTASTAPSGGAVFRVSLPALSSQESSSPPPRTPRARSRPTRILIVEDDPVLALSLERTLSDGHQAIVVPGGAEALSVLVRDNAFDVVLCNLLMPGMSGIELHEQVRERAPGYLERFVFMTNGPHNARVQQFFLAVKCPWLEKPFDTGELKQLLERMAVPA